MKRLAVFVAVSVWVVAFAVSVPAGPIPDIGGDPVHTQADYFSDGLWGLTVYSYVYDFTSSSLPDMGISLMSDEMLFVYLLDGNDTTTDSVEYFSVYNPDNLPVDTVGYNNTIIPTGYSGDDYQDPISYEYSGFSLTSSYYFTGGYMRTIEPDEWSLVFYVAICDSWGLATGTVAAGGADEHDVPAPEPLCIVDFHYFAGFAAHWLDTDCNDLNNWCAGADLNYNGDVNSLDLGLLSEEWLNSCPDNWLL